MSGNGISRKNQGLTDARSGYVNVQSLTGVPVWRLETETRTFSDYPFRMDAADAPWISQADWNRIATKHFPGCEMFSLKEMAEKSERYSDWRSLERAVTNTGSLIHFFRDGPIWATAVSSFDHGIERVYRTNQERITDGQQKGSLNRWIVSSSSSVR